MCWQCSLAAKAWKITQRNPELESSSVLKKYLIWQRHLLFQVIFCLPTHLPVSSHLRKRKSTSGFSITLTASSVTEGSKTLVSTTDHFLLKHIPEPTLYLCFHSKAASLYHHHRFKKLVKCKDVFTTYFQVISSLTLKKVNAGLKIARQKPDETCTFRGPIAHSFAKKEEELFLFTAAHFNPRPFQSLSSSWVQTNPEGSPGKTCLWLVSDPVSAPLPKGRKAVTTVFLLIDFSSHFPLSQSSTFLWRVLTKQFLVPLETITLQENTTLPSKRASHRAICQWSIFHSRRGFEAWHKSCLQLCSSPSFLPLISAWNSPTHPLQFGHRKIAVRIT